MQVTVTTRHIDDPQKVENLKKYVLKKLKKLERYIESKGSFSETKIVLGVEKFRNTAEIIINSGTFKAMSSSESEDMHTAIDRAIDGIIKQLKKQTEKRIKTKRKKQKEEIAAKGSETTDSTHVEESDDVIVERVTAKPMSVEEAILQLRVSDANFLTFRNSETGEINVLYKRKGNKMGLISP
ncbi:Ribosome hibernation promotion factor [bacterium HR37]|nr:Ribosome hibernation promotion factor [bacterium HR37]